MTLRNQMLAVAGAVALASLVLAEWRLYQDASVIAASCIEFASHPALSSQLSELCGQQAGTLTNTTVIRWISIGLVMLIGGRLGVLFARRKWRRDISAMLQRVRVLGSRSVKTEPSSGYPLVDKDLEIEEIAHALSALDAHMAASLQRMEADSQRATYATIAYRSGRDLQFVCESVRAAREVLETARRHQKLPPRQTIENLLFVEREVLALKRSLQADEAESSGTNAPKYTHSQAADIPDAGKDSPISRSLRPAINQGL